MTSLILKLDASFERKRFKKKQLSAISKKIKNKFLRLNVKKTNMELDQINATSTDSEPSAQSSVGMENIYPALVECFGIIALGYLAGR